MDYQEYLARTYFDEDGFDQAEFDRFAELIEGVRLFIDVGASHGVYTRQALASMKAGTIIALEADAERFAILERNVTEWVDDTDVDVRCVFAAASDDDDLAQGDSITFYTTGTQISGGLFPVGERSDEYEPVEVPLVRLDDLDDGSPRVLVKIDVEGGELRVLKGAEQLIRSGRARFFVELSWWGDRDRGTTVVSTLRHCWRSGLGISRRLRSDYLLAPEPDRRARAWQYARVAPALAPRYVFARLVPSSLRTRYIRRQNDRRLERFGDTSGTS